MRKSFVAVRTAYYKNLSLTKDVKKTYKVNQKQPDGTTKAVLKSQTVKKKYKSAIAEFEHVLRTGKTNSVNVFSEYSAQNITYSPERGSSPLDNYHKCRSRYKEITGKKCRSDMNTLFEHVVILSEENVLWLEKKLGTERAKAEIVKCLKNYANTYAEKYGFYHCGFSLHYSDEGHFDENNKFKRNVHAHVMFFNYDFKNKKSNLKHLMKKGIDPKTKKTRQLNENFTDIQDLAFQSFRSLCFKRGISKVITMAEYLPKNEYLLKKLKTKKNQYNKLLGDIEKQKNKFITYFENWLGAVVGKARADIYAQLAAESILSFEDEELKSSITGAVSATEKDIEEKTGDELSDNDSIVAHIKKKNNNKKRKL